MSTQISFMQKSCILKNDLESDTLYEVPMEKEVSFIQEIHIFYLKSFQFFSSRNAH